MASRKIHIRITEEDRQRLELIRAYHNVSLSDAFRIALVAMLEKLGFQKEFSDDLLKKK